MHALLQEYLIEVTAHFSYLIIFPVRRLRTHFQFSLYFRTQKISKKLHLSKFKLARFNDSCQLLVFYLMSCVWGLDVIIREGYFSQLSLLYDQFPNHQMIFLHKLFFVIQLAYYFHMLPELYLQKIKKEDQQPKIIHAICSFSFIALAYFLGFQRIALALLTIHYANEVVSHVFQLIDIFDRDEKLTKLHFVSHSIFILTRFGSVLLALLTLYYGIESSAKTKLALVAVMALQGFLIFQFFNNILRAKSEKLVEKSLAKKRDATAKNAKAGAGVTGEKSKKDRKKESDLPEADQNANSGRQELKKVK